MLRRHNGTRAAFFRNTFQRAFHRDTHCAQLQQCLFHHLSRWPLTRFRRQTSLDQHCGGFETKRDNRSLLRIKHSSQPRCGPHNGLPMQSLCHQIDEKPSSQHPEYQYPHTYLVSMKQLFRIHQEILYPHSSLAGRRIKEKLK